MKRNRKDGFTLIELIVVLVIIGLLSSLVLPRVFGSLTNVELKTAARDMVSLLHQARDFAYYKKKYTKVSIDLDTGEITISTYQNESQSRKNIISGPEMEWVLMQDYFLPQSVRVHQCIREEETITEGQFDIRFYPAGNTDGALVKLMNKKGRLFHIETDVNTGNSRISEEDGENG